MYASLLILAGISSIYSSQQNTCNVFPKDQYIEVGGSITIMCQSSCVVGKIYWTLNNREIDDSLSKPLNSTHTVLSLSNFIHPSATLQCHSANTQQVIGGTTIRSYPKPRNISCILHHTMGTGAPDLLTCTWENQRDSSGPVNYTVEGVFHRDSTTIQCKSQERNCTFKDFEALQNDSITVTVKAITDAGGVSSESRTFAVKAILKILPLKNLDVTENKGQLVVSWERVSPLKPCDCEVKCSKISAKGETVQCDRNEIKNPSTSIPESISIWSIVINNVESCINYTFSVRCAFKEAPWSDWSNEISHLTKPRKNDVHFKQLAGSDCTLQNVVTHNITSVTENYDIAFKSNEDHQLIITVPVKENHVKLQLWRKVSEVGKNGLRKVHVMWKGIPSTCEGTFIYTIKQMNGVNYTCDSTPCDVDVNQDAQRINLTVFHNEVDLVEKSVYVPAVGESFPQVTDIRTTSNDNVIQVSWNAPAQPASGYVIDWTQNGGQYYWKKSKYTSATLFDLLDKKPYNITVTPLFGDKTGQSTQALQVCSRFGDPDGIAISVESDHQSASVSWNTMSQGECSGAVISYMVYYYEGQNGPLLNDSVDSKKKNVVLKDLNPDTQYTVYVEATALTGRTKSSERKFATKKFDRQLLPVLIVSGTITIVVVLLLGLCFAVQWKKFKEKPVPNPSLSSVGVWAAQNHQKPQKICFQPFSNPSESPCDTVYQDRAQSTPTPSLVTGCDTNTASDYAEDYTNSDMTLAPHMRDESPVEPVEMPASPEESTALISSEGSPLNPYRSQSSVESPVPRASNQGKHATVKQQEKTPLKTVYVTLDMI